MKFLADHVGQKAEVPPDVKELVEIDPRELLRIKQRKLNEERRNLNRAEKLREHIKIRRARATSNPGKTAFLAVSIRREETCLHPCRDERSTERSRPQTSHDEIGRGDVRIVRRPLSGDVAAMTSNRMMWWWRLSFCVLPPPSNPVWWLCRDLSKMDYSFLLVMKSSLNLSGLRVWNWKGP